MGVADAGVMKPPNVKPAKAADIAILYNLITEFLPEKKIQERENVGS
jgi:hypothetical protein